eukprot:Gb_10621 [translate_table: standard]
MIELKH